MREHILVRERILVREHILVRALLIRMNRTDGRYIHTDAKRKTRAQREGGREGGREREREREGELERERASERESERAGHDDSSQPRIASDLAAAAKTETHKKNRALCSSPRPQGNLSHPHLPSNRRRKPRLKNRSIFRMVTTRTSCRLQRRCPRWLVGRLGRRRERGTLRL